MIDIEKLEEEFDLETANKLLQEGYCIRHVLWKEDEYVCLQDGMMFDKNGEEVGWTIITAEKDRRFELFYEEELCQETENEEKMEGSGIKEDGELKSKLNEEEHGTESEISVLSEKEKSESNKENITKKIKNESMKSEKETIRKTVSETLNEENSGPEIIERDNEKPNVTIIAKTEKTNCQKLKSEEGEMIRPLDSSQILIRLKEENSGSIQLLDDSAKQLHSYAKLLATPPRVDEETGEVIQRAPDHKVLEAVKCLDACRNMMKVKLDYLKFGKALIEE